MLSRAMNILKQMQQNFRKVGFGFPNRAKSGFADGCDHATMNDLPVPGGDWQKYYDERNGFYNAVLASGLIALGASIMVYKGCTRITWNASPPENFNYNEEFEEE